MAKGLPNKKKERSEMLKELLGMQKGIASLEEEMKHAIKDYKAKTKEYLGFEDGQPLNITQLLMVIDKVV